MPEKPTYEELERRIQELERTASNDREELNACLEKAQKFSVAFEGSHDAITLTTKGGTVLDCNQRALELFCLQSKNDFSAKRPADFSPPMQQDGRRSVEASRELIHKVFREGEPHRFEWLHQRKTGEAFPAEVILTPVTIGNRKVLQASIRDITERKQAETALRERNKELACLQRIRDSLDKGLSIDDICKRAIESLAQAMQFPFVMKPLTQYELVNTARMVLDEKHKK